VGFSVRDEEQASLLTKAERIINPENDVGKPANDGKLV